MNLIISRIIHNNKFNFLLVLLVVIYSFFINWFSGNNGVMVIDTFAFFDTGYSILQNKLPIRDFWVFTGIVVDYFQAFFFLIFGENWSSYIFHSSFFNILGSLGLYFFLKNLNLNNFLSFCYAISFATLCYPVSGTPFAYLHSYILSLLSIFFLCIALKKKYPILWFLIPLICYLAFFSMQTPSAYIILIIVFFSFHYFIKNKDLKSFNYFVSGGIFCLLFSILYIFLTKTPLQNIVYQYFLFPLSIGEERALSDPNAYVSLMDQINFKRIIGDFKFIHIFFFPLILLTIKSLFHNNYDDYQKKINLIIIFSVVVFIFNQLMTANQIYIFSLIPLIASILQININKFKLNYLPILLIFLILLFVTQKYHARYNIDRKFLDLENIDKTKALTAQIIDNKMKNLKWITPYDNPTKELDLINKAIKIIQEDTRKKTVLTHYQFISTVINEDLNIMNRWYLWENDTHPTETHKYFPFYKKFINENIEKNKIQVIYLLGQEKEILFKYIKNYFTDKCFKSKILIENRFSSHEIIECKN